MAIGSLQGGEPIHFNASLKIGPSLEVGYLPGFPLDVLLILISCPSQLIGFLLHKPSFEVPLSGALWIDK